MAAMDGFPTTKPAIKIQVRLEGKFPVGDIHTGSSLIGVPFSGGSIQSVEGFEPRMDMKITHGQDWVSIDADKKHARTDITAIASDEQGRSVRAIGGGVAELNDKVMAVFMDAPDAEPFPFGFATEQMRFQCGHEAYKALEDMLFAGSLRFAQDDNGLYVEARLSRIMPGSGFE